MYISTNNFKSSLIFFVLFFNSFHKLQPGSFVSDVSDVGAFQQDRQTSFC